MGDVQFYSHSNQPNTMNQKQNNQIINYFLVIGVIFLGSCKPKSQKATWKVPSYEMRVMEESTQPLIDQDHPASVGNKRGYEGGTVFRLDGAYHMFVTELINDWVRTRTGYWQSRDGVQWERVKTIMESPDSTGGPRNSLWSPMPFYNENEGRWNLFYVGYERDGQTHGRIFRAYSSVPGKEGLGGPYVDVPGTVLSYTDPDRDPWEGSQGAAAFYVYQVGEKWYGFYASGDSRTRWDEGLAVADSLEGEWKRDDVPNPQLTYGENPIVTQLDDGTWFCVFDDLAHGESSSTIGYAYSFDGKHWIQKHLDFPMPSWAINIRTPQSLIPAGENTWWVYFTAHTPQNFDCTGRMKVTIEKKFQKAADNRGS